MAHACFLPIFNVYERFGIVMETLLAIVPHTQATDSLLSTSRRPNDLALITLTNFPQVAKPTVAFRNLPDVFEISIHSICWTAIWKKKHTTFQFTYRDYLSFPHGCQIDVKPATACLILWGRLLCLLACSAALKCWVSVVFQHDWLLPSTWNWVLFW